jgi:hypothetical protein
MPEKTKGPAGRDRQTLVQTESTFSILTALPAETKNRLRAMAAVFPECVAADDPRVKRLGLQILWNDLGALLRAEGE